MSLRRTLKRLRGRLAMRWGRAGSSRPLSSDFGCSRGTPVDRHYIEAFLQQHAGAIRGRVLEIGDDSYSRRFGGGAVQHQDVLHVRDGHPGATIIGDLTDPRVLPPGAFDCIIITQTLHLIYDLVPAVCMLRRALRPGGVALITVPGITPIDRGEWGNSWYWSLTDLSLKRVLGHAFAPDDVATTTYGNLFAATAFLHGAALEEVGTARLGPLDPAYPVIVAARASAGLPGT